MSTDPIQLELFRNLFEAAAEEMGITLQRVAFSANIKERRDFSCALFSPAGDLLAQAAHIPVHLGSMPASVAAVLRAFPNPAPGDTYIVNDPFQGGSHLPDITLVTPIFQGPTSLARERAPSLPAENAPPLVGEGGGEGHSTLLGFAANRAHHADVGGATPGSMTLSRHIDEEGVRIEPALLQSHAGSEHRELRDQSAAPDSSMSSSWNRPVLDRLLAAVRTPDERLGDLQAQLAANHVGATALRRMIDRHGLPTVEHYGRTLLDYAQSFMSRAIAAIPPGEYAFEDALDDDGADNGPFPIHVTIRIAGDRATVDLTRSADAAQGCINCPESVTRSAVYYCFACLLDPHVPLNAGAFRNIDVLTRSGSLLHAEYPAAVVAGNTETSQRVVDVIFGALAQALPARIPAASCGTMSSVALGSHSHAGAERRALRDQSAAPDRDAWTYYETIGGGSGASPTRPGASAVQCHMTNTLNTPAEALELQYPLRVRRFERAAETGGRGANTGGDGIIRALEALEDCEGTILSDRRVTRPYGLAAGEPAAAGENHIRRADERIEGLAGKAQFTLQKGDVLHVRTPGGGGWGSTS